MTRQRIPTTCDDCGACCMSQNLLPATWQMSQANDIPLELAKELFDALGQPFTFGDDNCPCLWLDRATAKCKHYEHRPEICGEFAIGSDECLAQRNRHATGIDAMELL